MLLQIFLTGVKELEKEFLKQPSEVSSLVCYCLTTYPIPYVIQCSCIVLCADRKYNIITMITHVFSYYLSYTLRILFHYLFGKNGYKDTCNTHHAPICSPHATYHLSLRFSIIHTYLINDITKTMHMCTNLNEVHMRNPNIVINVTIF